ncbi:MAG: hypothetical protein MH132_12815 [Hydrotalea sp.]|nr:hypothetical protein [Hydrotalea sp.]
MIRIRFSKFHDSYNIQQEYERLLERINQINQPEHVNYFAESILEFSSINTKETQSRKNFSWLTDEYLTFQLNKNEYYRKAKKYKVLKKELEQKYWHALEGKDQTVTDELSFKLKILTDLIKNIQYLLSNYTEEAKQEFDIKEISAYKYFDEDDLGTLNNEICFLIKNDFYEDKHLKSILRKISHFLKLLIIDFSNDIRKMFRKIIQFFFKNMDDEKLINNFLVNISKKLLNKSIFTHEQLQRYIRKSQVIIR